MPTCPVISKDQARRLWIRAQRLDTKAPFGAGPSAAQAAIEQLGYVQIDTINVIERCHHHILYSRIPEYQRADLAHLQSTAKSVFEYWTHALAYVSASDFRYFMDDMAQVAKSPGPWLGRAKLSEVKKILARSEIVKLRKKADEKTAVKAEPPERLRARGADVWFRARIRRRLCAVWRTGPDITRHSTYQQQQPPVVQ